MKRLIQYAGMRSRRTKFLEAPRAELHAGQLASLYGGELNLDTNKISPTGGLTEKYGKQMQGLQNGVKIVPQEA